MSVWEETLKDIGITGNQARVYATCVGLGAKTASELAIYTGLTIPEVEQELEKLQLMGVIKKIPGRINFYIALTPRIALTGMVAESLKNRLEGLKNSIMERAGKAIESLTQNVVLFKERLDKSLSTYLKEVKASSAQLVGQLLASTRESLEGFQSEVNQLSQSIEQYLEQMLSDHEKDSRETIRSLVESANEAVRLFRSDIQQVKETSESVLRDFIEQTRVSIGEFQEKLEAAVNDAINTFESRTGDVSGRATSEVTALFTDFEYAFDQTLKEVREISLQPLTTINENAISVSKTAMSGVVEFAEGLGPLTETQITNTQSFTNMLLADIRANLETSRTKLLGLTKQFEETVNSQATRLRDLILEESRAVSSTLREYISSYQSEILRVIETFRDQTVESLVTLEGTLGALGRRVQDIISTTSGCIAEQKDLFEQTEVGVSQQLQAMGESLGESLRLAGENISNSINMLVDASRFLDESLSRIEIEQGQIIESALTEIFEGYSAMVKSEVESCVKEQITSLNNLQNAFKEVIQSSLYNLNQVLESQEKVFRDFEGLARQALDSVDSEAAESAKNAVRETAQEFATLLSELQRSVLQEFENTRNRISQKLGEFAENLKTSVSSMREDYQAAIGQTLGSILEEFENHGRRITESFNRSKADMEERLRTTSQQVATSLEKSREELKSSIGEVRLNLERQAKEWEESVFARKTLDSDALREKMESMERFIDEQENTLKAFLEEESRRVESELEARATEIEEEGNALRRRIQSRKESFLEASENSIEALLVRISEANSGLVNSLSESLERRTQLTKKHLDDFVSDFDSESASLKNSLTVNFTDSVALQRTKMTGFEETLATHLSRVVDILQFIEEKGGDKKKFSLGTDETEELMERVTSSKNEIMRLRDELRMSVNELNENLAMVSTNILDELDRSLTYLSESFGKKTQKTIQSLLDDDAKTREEVRQAVEGSFQNTISPQIVAFRERNENALNELQAEIDTQIDKQLKSVEELFSDAADHLKSSRESCVSVFGAIKCGVKEQLEGSSEVVQRVLIENYETARRISEEAQEQLGSLFERIQEVLDSTHRVVSESANTVTEANLNSLQELATTLSEATSLENTREKLDRIESGQQSELNQTVASFSTQLDELISSLESGNDELVGSVKKFILEKVSGTIEQTRITLEELENRTKKVAELYRELNKSIENGIGRILEEQESFGEQTRAALGSFLEETVQQLNEEKANAESLVSALETNLESILQRERQTILSKSAEVVQRIGQEREKAVGEATQQLNQVAQNLNEVLASAKAQLESQIQGSVSRFRSSIEQLSERTKSSLEESLGNLTQAMENTNEDTRRIITQTRETVNNLLASRDEIQKISQESLAVVESYAEQVTTQASTLGGQVLHQVSEEKTVLEDNLESEINESVTQTSQRLESFLTDLKESLNGYVEKVAKLVEMAEKEVYPKIDQEFEALRKQLTEQKEKLGDTLVKKRDEIREKQEKLQKGVEEVISTLRQELPSYVEKIKYDLLSTLDRHSRESRDSAEVKLESLAGITDKPFANLESKLLDFDRELGLSFEKRHSELKSKTYETLGSLRDDHTAFGEALNSMYSEAEQALSQKIDETVSNHLKEISKTITMTKINIEENERNATLVLNTFTEDIPEKIGEIITSTDDALKLITRIMKLSEEIEPKPFEDTERIVGREQVLNLLRTFIRNTKSTITILTPRIEDVPTEDLARIPRRRVTIITDAEGKAPPMPTPNIQVKHYSGNVYAFNRDSEEMILAVATPEPLGIYTTNMELIKLLNIILQDVSARAKRV
ncbi:MAG: helix-turn-helix domain-containing protein [Candidatus Freyarchaeota archaeon]